MPVYRIDELEEELVTPKHSSALGRLVTGEQIEVGVLRFQAGEGAHELCVLGPRDVAHMPPNVPHRLECLEDAELVSAKGIVGGVGHRI